MATIQSRGRNKWLVRVFRGRDSQGKQQFRNQTIIGTKKDAEAFAYEEQRRTRLIGTNAVLSFAIGELLDDLQTYYQNNELRLDWCELVVRAHLRPFFGAVPASKLTTDHAHKYIAARRAEGAKAGTINRELGLLRRALNLASKECTPPKLDRVPKIPRLEENGTRKGFFEDHEYRAVFAELPERLKPLVAFGYYTGCRRGEVLALEWSQVDLLEGMVRLEPGTTKNKRARMIPLNPELLEMFKMQKAIRDEKYPSCPWVFFTPTGERIRDFRGAWDAACIRAGLVNEKGKPLRLFHDLRRTAVRNLVRSGNSEKVAMQISGHRSRSVFDRYDIVTEQDLKRAASRQHEYLAEMRSKAALEKTQSSTESCTIVALTPSEAIQ
jgi:integrase